MLLSNICLLYLINACLHSPAITNYKATNHKVSVYQFLTLNQKNNNNNYCIIIIHVITNIYFWNKLLTYLIVI